MNKALFGFLVKLPDTWEQFLHPYFDLPVFYEHLNIFLRQFEMIIPEQEKIFAVFDYILPQDVTCVLYGEDPYPRKTSACGVAFWDKEINSWEDKTDGNSLKNILKALLVHNGKATYNTSIAECRKIVLNDGFISPPELFELWLDQGVLLINSALTFCGQENKKLNMLFWKPFHLALVRALNVKNTGSPFYILWGNKAASWKPDIEASIDDVSKIINQGHPTFIHQFLDPQSVHFSPFREIITKTGLTWF